MRPGVPPKGPKRSKTWKSAPERAPESILYRFYVDLCWFRAIWVPIWANFRLFFRCVFRTRFFIAPGTDFNDFGTSFSWLFRARRRTWLQKVFFLKTSLSLSKTIDFEGRRVPAELEIALFSDVFSKHRFGSVFYADLCWFRLHFGVVFAICFAGILPAFLSASVFNIFPV